MLGTSVGSVTGVIALLARNLGLVHTFGDFPFIIVSVFSTI